MKRGDTIMKKKGERMAPDTEKLLERAMFENPCASVMDRTGCVPRIPDSEPAAESYCDILDVPVTALDGSEACKKAK